MSCRNGGVGTEQQRDADVPSLQGLQRQRAPGVEPYELPKMEPVSPSQPGQAINALGALGRTAEHQPRRPPGQVGDRAQAISGRGGGGHHDDVGVLRARRASGDEPPPSGPPGQGPAGRPATDVADSRPTLRNSRADPEYSGTIWTRPLSSAGSTSSRVPDVGQDPDGEPGGGQGACVQSASSTLSGKIERPECDDGPRRPASLTVGHPAARRRICRRRTRQPAQGSSRATLSVAQTALLSCARGACVEGCRRI